MNDTPSNSLANDQTISSVPSSSQFDDVASGVDDIVNEALGGSLDKNERDEVAESDQVADTLISLQNLIERNANELDRLKQQQKELRESLKNIFENDAELSEASAKADELTQTVKQRKQSLDNSSEARQLKLKLGDLKEEITEIEESLNEKLINLFQITGSNSFDTSEGDQREFVIKARVKPKKAKAE